MTGGSVPTGERSGKRGKGGEEGEGGEVAQQGEKEGEEQQNKQDGEESPALPERTLFPHVTDRLRSGIDARQGQQKKHQRVLAERAGEIPLEQGGDHPLRAAARTIIACGRKDQAGRAQGVEQQAQEKQGEQHGGGPQRAANGFPLHGHPPFRQSVPVLI